MPGRLQSAAEMTYEFVATTVHLTGGHDGMQFFPFVFTLFLFVLVLEPDRAHPLYVHGHQSQIFVTFALAALVIGVVIVYGLYRHGTAFPEPLRAVGVSPSSCSPSWS